MNHPKDVAALLRQARALANAQASGLKPLLGRRIALLSHAPGDEDGQQFLRAAKGLGAYVSFVRPDLDDGGPQGQIHAAARVMGRLYDAIECQRLSMDVVQRIASSAGIPVFAGLATAHHPTAALVEMLDSETPWDVRRHRILQAALIVSMS